MASRPLVDIDTLVYLSVNILIRSDEYLLCFLYNWNSQLFYVDSYLFKQTVKYV
jgi:hypothetical protein